MVASVPDSDSLRRAALQASWQRGRWVARRRLWWRWAAWALLCIVLPTAAVLGLIGALMQGRSVATDMPASVPPTPPAQTPAAPRSAPLATLPATAPDPSPAPNASLRLDWAVSARHGEESGPTPASSPASATTTNVGDSRP